MIIKRNFWLKKIDELLAKRSVLWIYGPRRTGKTSLCRSVPGAKYYDCELPEVKRVVSAPGFLESVSGQTIILDEIHRLENPSEILKIAADYHRDTKIIATGSSTLNAYKSFRDTLAGRKYNLKLTPAMSVDLEDFGIKDYKERMLKGGLPGFLLGQWYRKDYSEWMDSYWAKDVEELFNIEKRAPYLKLIELLMANSGGIFDAVSYASDCGISRPTVISYLSAVELTGLISVIRPFSRIKSNEIVKAPKIYGFDSGFVAFYKGWESLRQDDLGMLWENLVLNEFLAAAPDRQVNYWRDKQGHEIDFVIAGSRGSADIIECKWSQGNLSADNTEIFRKKYPEGKNYAVVYDAGEGYKIKLRGIEFNVIGLKHIKGLF